MGIYTESMDWMEVWEEMVDGFHNYTREENTSDILDNIDDGIGFEEDRGFAELMEE